jgi:hypothetical protein
LELVEILLLAGRIKISAVEYWNSGAGGTAVGKSNPILGDMSSRADANLAAQTNRTQHQAKVSSFHAMSSDGHVWFHLPPPPNVSCHEHDQTHLLSSSDVKLPSTTSFLQHETYLMPDLT